MSLTDIADAFSATILSGSLALAVLVAVIAGIVAFVSPCVLPVVPGYLGYVSGLAGQSIGGGARRGTGRMVAGSALFVAGFTVVFMLIGGFVGAIGYLLQAYAVWIDRVAGVLVILMGLLFLGAFPGLSGEKRLTARPDAGLLGAPLMGAIFGFAWTPCIGPTFAAVVALSLGAGGSAERGAILALAYSLGLGLPFILFALLFQRALAASRAISEHRRIISILSGAVLIIIGTLLLTGQWSAWMAELSTTIGSYETVV